MRDVLQLAMTEKLDDADLKNEAKVREKIKDLIKLGEMKWRYRVVEEEQSPRDEAIKVLDEAIRYIDSHVTFMLQAEGAKDITTHAKWAYKERHWAPELSECSQGLALARLIFNRDRGEDETIDNLLREALQLREILKDKAKLADTENSLGSLAQKQANFTEAERHYKLALELRREILPASEAQHKEKDQFLAQSYTSLGNLYHDWGAARCAEKDGSHDLHMSMALEHLAQAKTHYVKGFNPRHPKVAWAVEAQANVHKKMRNYTLAIACVNEAIALRKGLQNKSDGKALFSKEIEKDADALSELEKGQRSAGAFKKVVKGGIRAERKALFAEGKLKSTLYDSVGDFASIASTIPPALPDNHPGERARRVSHEKVLHTPPSSKPPSVAHIKAANRRKSLAPHMC